MYKTLKSLYKGISSFTPIITFVGTGHPLGVPILLYFPPNQKRKQPHLKKMLLLDSKYNTCTCGCDEMTSKNFIKYNITTWRNLITGITLIIKTNHFPSWTPFPHKKRSKILKGQLDYLFYHKLQLSTEIKEMPCMTSAFVA